VTVYTPVYNVSRNGEDLLDATIDEVNIIHGRQDVQDQPFPASMTLRCFSNAGTNLNFQLDDQIEFYIDNLRQFIGYISQIDITMTPGTNNSNIAYYDISCAGPLAFLSRTNAANLALPEEGDATRVESLIFRAFSQLWSDLGTAGLDNLSWNNYAPTFQWQDFAPAYPFATNPVISATNSYTLSAEAASKTDTLTLAQSAAQSGRGILYDSRDGAITYDNYFERQTPTLEITVNSDMLLTESITSSLNTADLVNIVTIEYTGGGTQTAINQPSIDLYGPRVATKITTLENSSDALTQAADYVISRAIPQYAIRSFTVPLHIDEITAEMRGDLLTLDLNTTMTWPAALLPEPLKQYTDTINFVEGWNLRANRTSIYLTVNQSPRSYTYGHKMWLEINNATTWITYDPLVEWKDA
jgi:hypothetical protein